MVSLTLLLLAAAGQTPVLEPETAVRTEVQVSFTEGPAPDAEGNVYFTDTRSKRIMRWSPRGGLSVFRENSAANGLQFDAEWRLLAAEPGTSRVTRTNVKTGEVQVLAQNTPETPIRQPNDVTVDGKGRIYFTDYRGGAIYRIDPDGKVVRILGPAEGVEVPNGIVISQDDRILYYVESNGKEGGKRCIRAFDLGQDGAPANGRVFYNFYPGRSADGIAIDTKGNIYAAAGLNRTRGTSETLDTKAGIHVISPEGKLLKRYPVWEDTVTNCAFGGPDMRTLYITAGKTVFSVRTDIPGTRR